MIDPVESKWDYLSEPELTMFDYRPYIAVELPGFSDEPWLEAQQNVTEVSNAYYDQWLTYPLFEGDLERFVAMFRELQTDQEALVVFLEQHYIPGSHDKDFLETVLNNTRPTLEPEAITERGIDNILGKLIDMDLCTAIKPVFFEQIDAQPEDFPELPLENFQRMHRVKTVEAKQGETIRYTLTPFAKTSITKLIQEEK